MPTIAEQHKNTSEQISPDGMPLASDKSTQVAAAPASEVIPDKSAEKVEETPKTTEQQDAEHIAEHKQGEDENVDIMDFLNASGRDASKEVVEEKKVDATPVGQTATKVVNARDYSDIEPTHKAAFERMSNEAFNLLKPVYLEHKQLKAKSTEIQAEIAKRDDKIKQLTEGKPQVPENYYEHENAFLLTPEFANASNTVNSYNTIVNHWQQQLDSVRSGNSETYQTIHVHPETGQFYLSAPMAVTKDTERQLQSYVQFAQGKMMETQAEINFMAKSHKARHSESIGWIKNFETQAFKNFETDETMKAMVNDAVKQFPAPFRANPLAPAFAKALLTISQLGKLLQSKGQPAPQSNGKQAATPKTGNISAAEIAGEGGGKKQETSEISFDDFKRAMQ